MIIFNYYSLQFNEKIVFIEITFIIVSKYSIQVVS